MVVKRIRHFFGFGQQSDCLGNRSMYHSLWIMSVTLQQYNNVRRIRKYNLVRYIHRKYSWEYGRVSPKKIGIDITHTDAAEMEDLRVANILSEQSTNIRYVGGL